MTTQTYSNYFNYAKILAVAAAPAALALATQADLQNQRIGKLVSGMGLFSLGIYLMAKSDEPQMTPHRLIRWSLAGTGLAATLVCAYSIATGFTERLVPQAAEFQSISNEIQKKINPPLDPLSSCKEQLKTAKEELFECPLAKKIWEDVQSEGEFSITCLSAEELSHPAMANIAEREIMLSTYKSPFLLSTSMLKGLFFELNNLKQSSAYLKNYKDFCSVEKNQFAKRTEALEYNTYKNTHEAIEQCVKDGFWDSEKFPQTAKHDLMNYTMEAELAGHTNAYRLHWVRQCKPELVAIEKKWLQTLHNMGIVPLPQNFNDDAL